MDDTRFSISAEIYLERHQICTYLEDAVAQLLEHKEENPKVNHTKFFSDYFTNLKEGNHVLFREYAYVQATPHNRACFVRVFWKCFRHIGRKGDLLSIREYHSLLCLLCPDFPFPPVQKTARIILMDDAQDCLISFPDFLFAFQAQFCYDEFLTKCADVYKTLMETSRSPHDPVVVPTSEENLSAPHTNSAPVSGVSSSSDGVDAMQFFRSLVPVCDKLDLRAPPVAVLKEILAGAERVTFYGFLMAMAKSESLNKSIGKLPSKGELLDMSDQELTTPVIRPGSGKAHSTGSKLHRQSGSTTAPPSVASENIERPKTAKPSISKSSNSTISSVSSKKSSTKVIQGSKSCVVTVNTSDDDDDDDDDDDSDDSGSSTN